MVKINKSDKEKFWITKMNDNSVIHYGDIKKGNYLSSGLDSLETFGAKKDFIIRLSELGIEYKDGVEVL